LAISRKLCVLEDCGVGENPWDPVDKKASIIAVVVDLMVVIFDIKIVMEGK